MFIQSKHIYLRALEKADADLLYNIENNQSVWQISNTLTPISKDVLLHYLESAYQDIYTTKQLRLIICKCETNEPLHQRIGLGILILEEFRKNGYAFESIELIKEYVFKTLLVNQLYCNIGASNISSQLLFKKCGFAEIGIKKQWNKISSTEFEDEILFQCFH
jgi:diamine N-acetyltransferase